MHSIFAQPCDDVTGLGGLAVTVAMLLTVVSFTVYAVRWILAPKNKKPKRPWPLDDDD